MNTANLEEERIKTLKKYDILDTPPDGSFDRITKLAAKLLNVPIAIVTMVDTDRIWFKSKYGIDAQQIGHDPGLCASAIMAKDVYVVEDARVDARTLSNPLVAGEFGLQFYAAAPLEVSGGFNLGTLCIIDKHPRILSEEDKQVLQDLAHILIDQLELRLATRTAIFKQNELLSIAVHDLKTPLTTIPIWADLISKEKDDTISIQEMCERIKVSSTKMTRIINELLESARQDSDAIKLRLSILDLSDIISKVVSTNEVLAISKGQELHYQATPRIWIKGDENKLIEIADNLINNAIKFSPKNTSIHIDLREENDKAIFEITDQGPGINKAERNMLFQRFARLSAKPTNGESSSGLGLSIVKSLVEAHDGEVWMENGPEGQSAKFIVAIPTTRGR